MRINYDKVQATFIREANTSRRFINIGEVSQSFTFDYSIFDSTIYKNIFLTLTNNITITFPSEVPNDIYFIKIIIEQGSEGDKTLTIQNVTFSGYSINQNHLVAKHPKSITIIYYNPRNNTINSIDYLSSEEEICIY